MPYIICIGCVGNVTTRTRGKSLQRKRRKKEKLHFSSCRTHLLIANNHNFVSTALNVKYKLFRQVPLTEAETQPTNYICPSD